MTWLLLHDTLTSTKDYSCNLDRRPGVKIKKKFKNKANVLGSFKCRDLLVAQLS